MWNKVLLAFAVTAVHADFYVLPGTHCELPGTPAQGEFCRGPYLDIDEWRYGVQCHMNVGKKCKSCYLITQTPLGWQRGSCRKCIKPHWNDKGTCRRGKKY